MKLLTIARDGMELLLPFSLFPIAIVTDAVVGAANVFGNDAVDLQNGDFTIQDAVATGGETGGLILVAIGIPEVGLPVMIFFGQARDFGL